MLIEDYVNFTLLFDTYGKLLSKKQYEVMDKFLNLNLSESELAEQDGRSRQSVHDAVAKAKKQLLEFEETLGVVAEIQLIKSKLIEAKAFLNTSNESEKKASDILDDVIKRL